MSVLRRNITGHDILALREFISTDGPVTEDEIKHCFFPGDATESSISDKLKLITDAIGFLEETEQIVEETDGYRLHEGAASATSPQISILSGLYSQFGENGAYRDVLGYLASEDQTLANRKGELQDAMNGYSPDTGWNTTNLGYWERTMDCLGLITKVHGDDATMVFVLEYDLWRELLNNVCETRTTRLEDVLSNLHDVYVPVWTSGGTIAKHVQYGLAGLEEHSEIDLRKESDAGATYEVDSKGVNTIELTTQF
ncbi:hypothetical protein [Natronolimnobius baerhuensis]|uniref:Uncharacterized protein n=1 Tax=Natronolimnobius baerhuensis TaxID=253108 RepID=A0A202E3V3_9EURY|nr:hypothetical protein [Natronolimnobius baerhuensis]OVE82963.1 hypothetical protein B2G88_18420 [Natronolimnobius baerhuensis]